MARGVHNGGVGAPVDRDVSEILRAVAAQRPHAAEDLLPLIYDELRRVARARVRPGHTLQATALVHEVWMKMVGDEDPGWDGRAHFFGAAAQAMREILVDHARRRSAVKRGGDHVRVDESWLDDIRVEVPTEDLLALDEALDQLEEYDELKARIVGLRFFAGLTMREVADALGVTLSRVEEDWRFSRAWLRRKLQGGAAE